MSPEALTELLLQYRYWILIPLSLIEGPVVAFIAGALAALGYFNFYALAAIFFVRDVGLDAAYYALGHYGGKTAFVQRMLAKIQVTPDHLEQVRLLWMRRPGWTMFIGKLSYGIAAAFIIVAGTVRMSLPTFFKWAAIVAVTQYGALLLAGYFFGNTLGGSAARFIENTQYVILAASLALALYYYISWRMRKKLLKERGE